MNSIVSLCKTKSTPLQVFRQLIVAHLLSLPQVQEQNLELTKVRRFGQRLDY